MSFILTDRVLQGMRDQGPDEERNTLHLCSTGAHSFRQEPLDSSLLGSSLAGGNVVLDDGRVSNQIYYQYCG